MRPLIDLVSDTSTKPTPAMIDAMMSAELGDEQKGEDPTTNELEARGAKLLGTEKAVLFPTATMANQVALSVMTRPGDEVICHETAHILNYEAGGTAVTSSIQMHPVTGLNGQFSGETFAASIRMDDPHFSPTTAVVIENTSNGGGGTVWEDGLFQAVTRVAKENKIDIHIDGARIANAAVKSGKRIADWGSQVTTVQMCFSKGLGCPFGALLGMPARLEKRVRRRKQSLGGALRQSGIVAGAMLYSLDHHMDRLADDHRRTHDFFREIASDERIQGSAPETNLAFFKVSDTNAIDFCNGLLEHRVRMAPTPDGRIRTCFHLDIDDDGLTRAIAATKAVLQKLR